MVKKKKTRKHQVRFLWNSLPRELRLRAIDDVKQMKKAIKKDMKQYFLNSNMI